MSIYMRYQGRAVEISNCVVKGRRIPRLYPGDQGEKWGDFAVVDEQIVLWDGARWLPVLDRQLQGESDGQAHAVPSALSEQRTV